MTVKSGSQPRRAKLQPLDATLPNHAAPPIKNSPSVLPSEAHAVSLIIAAPPFCYHSYVPVIGVFSRTPGQQREGIFFVRFAHSAHPNSSLRVSLSCSPYFSPDAWGRS
jgi:hypothetical protein